MFDLMQCSFPLIERQVIFTQLIDRIEPLTPEATQTLILVHRRELVEQAARHCTDAYPSKTVEIEMGNIHASGVADITIASVQSIVSGDRMIKFEPKKFKLVLVDEAHHIVAASYMEVLKYFGLTNQGTVPKLLDNITNRANDLLTAPATKTSPVLVGVSATFSRFDGLRLSDAIDRIVYHKDYVDMIGEKWLSAVVFTTVQSKADFSKVKAAGTGDFQIRPLSRAVNTQQTNEVTVRAWMTKAADRKSTLVFCVDLAHVLDLTATFRRHGFKAEFVMGDTPKRIRSERLDAFRRGDYPVLLNCGVFTEGTDIPNIDCVLLARPTRSRNLLVQMIGRGMRLYPGKKDCHIIDMVASLEVGVVSTPTLFGLDPASLIEAASVEELKTQQANQKLEARHEECAALRAASKTEAEQMPTNITFTDYDSVLDLINDTSSERHIRGISQLAWVMVRPNRYVLSNRTGDYITIEASESGMGYTVVFMKKLFQIASIDGNSKARSPYMRGRQIAQADQLTDAVHAADTFAVGKFSWQFVHHGQTWRKAPATEGQIAFLNKLRPMNDHLTEDMLTKGKATDMISKLKFGAKGWFSNIDAAKKRAQRAGEKQRQVNNLKHRQDVKVGPIPPATNSANGVHDKHRTTGL